MVQKDNLNFSVNRTWVIFFALILLIVGVLLLIRDRGFSGGASRVQLQSPSPDATASIQSNWQTFENKQYKISFKYPPLWSVSPSSQIFENGDLVAVQFIGQTQTAQTELYDGARFVVMIPQPTSQDLNSWVNSKHTTSVSGTPPQISDTSINGMSFRKVYECGLGCFTYYYTVVGRQVYGIMVSADGPQKVELEATIDQMLNTLVLPK